MRKIPAAAVLLLLTIACGKSPVDRVVTPDGQVITGTMTALDGAGIEIGELLVSAPTDQTARINVAGGASYTGTVRYDGEVYTASTGMGQLELQKGRVASIYWPPTDVATDLVDVPADGSWYNTHLAVERGTVITVMAAGRASIDTGATGPAGQEQFSSAIAQVPEATNGQLVMRVGTESTPLAVGSSWNGAVEASGEVYLAVNSPPDSTAGYYTVSLALQEPAGTGHWAVYPHLSD